MKRFIVLMTILSILTCIILARDIKIVSAIDHDPLPYSTVKYLNHHRGALGDSLGIVDVIEYENDSILISYTGYEDIIIPISVFEEDTIVYMNPRVRELDEVVVRPQGKSKHKTYGKSHKFGLLPSYIELKKGENLGVSVCDTKHNSWLTHIGFYTNDSTSVKSGARMMLNIYDISEAEGSSSNLFYNILDAPIFIDYDRSLVSDGKFRYTMPDPILLPQKAFIELVFLDNDGYVIFKSNLVGDREWMRSMNDKYWVKSPFATPIFVECDVYNKSN